MNIKFIHNFEISDLVDLYNSVGWTTYTCQPEILKGAVANSSLVVSYWEGQNLIGLARCLSDDFTIMYLQDVLVKPSHHRRGIGRRLLTECLKRYQHVRQIVLLTDDDPIQTEFYKSLGLTNIKEIQKGTLNTFILFKDSVKDPGK